ncbi:MAG: thioredoxin domain-containing protein [bacterium]|nr:thioredoxin domain-containing protein [bacterium]
MQEGNDFLNGPPKTMFVFGLVTGIAIAALFGVFSGGATGPSAERAKTQPTAAAAAQAPAAAPSAPTAGLLPEVTDADWVRGDLSKAKVVMVEYSDFECPFCGRHHPSMLQMMDEFGDDVAWVYRHFPLSFHPQAQPSAVASECVGEQGGHDAFWAFTDVMFENQTALGTPLYEKTVQDIGLDLALFRTCVTSGKYDSKIANDQAGGGAAGVTGTPATFINGQIVSGAVPAVQMQQMISGLLGK